MVLRTDRRHRADQAQTERSRSTEIFRKIERYLNLKMEAGTFISGYQLQAITILLADFLLAAIHVIKHTELHTWPFWSGMSEG